MNQSTADLKRPSLPALATGSDMSPRTAKPCVRPSKILALVSRREAREKLVRLCAGLEGELRVCRARVDQERRLRLSNVFLAPHRQSEQSESGVEDAMYLEIVGRLKQRWVRDDANLDDVVECEIEHVSACTTNDQSRHTTCAAQ